MPGRRELSLQMFPCSRGSSSPASGPLPKPPPCSGFSLPRGSGNKSIRLGCCRDKTRGCRSQRGGCFPLFSLFSRHVFPIISALLMAKLQLSEMKNPGGSAGHQLELALQGNHLPGKSAWGLVLLQTGAVGLFENGAFKGKGKMRGTLKGKGKGILQEVEMKSPLQLLPCPSPTLSHPRK